MQQGGGGGDMDRQLQDEMRRRQMAAQQEQQQAAGFSALQQQQQQQFMMDPNSPYYAQRQHAAAAAAHAAAYRHAAAAANPYGASLDAAVSQQHARAAAAGYGNHLATPVAPTSGTAGASGADGGAASNPQQLARLYAEQQRRQAQMGGGYPPHPYAHMDPRFVGHPPAGAYSGGVPPTPNYTREQQQHQELVMQHHHQQAAAAAAAQQQHHAAAAAAAQQYRDQQDSAQKKAAAATTPSSSNGGPKSPPPKSSIPSNQLIPQSPVVSTAQAAAAAGAASATKSSPSSNKKKDGEEEDSPSSAASPSSPSSPAQSSGKPTPSGPLVRRSLGKDMPQHRQVDNLILDENDQRQWYTGCLPLGLTDDKYWLSELQVYLRANFAEAFGATEEDIAAPMHGRNKPIALGQVGIRCMHCKYDNPAERGQQATSYPSLISGIYNSVQQMLRLHLDCCLSMPPHVRAKIEQLKLSCSSRGGRKQYWIDSAKRLGLQDTPHGIHFGRDPGGPLPPLAGPSVNSKEARRRKQPPPKASPDGGGASGGDGEGVGAENGESGDSPAGVPDPVQAPLPKLERPTQPPVDSRPLVFPEDKPLISDYLYLTLEQMAPCNLMEADRVGCYKTRQVGFPGLACKHCVGQAGCGRYFPASEASLSQTTTSQTIMNHVRNCRRCPIEIRENLEIMKRNRMGPDGKRADKPKHGGRKVFFHRLWCRIQDIPFEEGKGERKESKKRTTFKKPGPQPTRAKKKNKKRDRRRSIEDSDDEGGSNESETDTDTEDAESDGSEQDAKPKAKGSGKGTAGMAKRKAMSPWYEGCVRLTKTDDPHWLSEMECFARSDLVEVFSLKKKDSLDGYGGRKEPAIGQVGIRCVFCKNVDASERSNGCISFPDMLSSIHTKVADMTRLHFPNCPSMPEETQKTFKSLRRDDAKVANDDSQQYWVDAARDLGLANIPPDGIGASGSWGVTFRRDPLQPSPADELDLDTDETTWGKNLMVKPTDRGLCTDHVLLMLCQVRPCRFRKSDRRAGPGSRGRDRAMGFPGLACMHCANRNSLGRYFPVSAKNLTDNTANSLQAHISSCSRCPEHIQASLAYLSHRSILQKAELSGSWKKAFFKKVWDRLHVDRSWTAIEDEGQQEGIEYDSADSQDEAQHAEEEGDEDEEEEEGDEEGKEGEEDGGEEKQEGQMDALIQAAAIWLTEQDEATGSTKSSGGRGKGRSGGGTKRSAAAASGSRGGRGNTSLPTKRRRGGGTT